MFPRSCIGERKATSMDADLHGSFADMHGYFVDISLARV